MKITDIIAGRNEAMSLVNGICGPAANTDPFAWSKMDRVRSYLQSSTVAECDGYFAPENDIERGVRELGAF
jgi:hypothetical protein